MFAIGDSLREARTRRGLSAADVQKGIRIRERYLTALEEERWELLPGEAYTKGFLRTYAEFLGLERQPLHRRVQRAHRARATTSRSSPSRSSPRIARGAALLRTLDRRPRASARSSQAVAALGSWAAAVSVRDARRSTPATPAAKPRRRVGRSATQPAVAEARREAGGGARDPRGPSGAAGSRSGSAARTARSSSEGVLEQGKTLRFAPGARTLWVRMGRPNVARRSRVGGQLVGGLPGTPGERAAHARTAPQRLRLAQPAAASASSTAGTSPHSSSSL